VTERLYGQQVNGNGIAAERIDDERIVFLGTATLLLLGD
jgi:hypothetical protein